MLPFHSCWIILTILPTVAMAQSTGILRWSELPSLPNSRGFAGPFSGTHGGSLLVAGGANFPDKMPWEGGVKIWYDTVYALDQSELGWRVVGRLPRPLGYGVSLSVAEGVVCLGGSDANRHYADCFRIEYNKPSLSCAPLPPLPMACANFSGGMIGRTIYVAGGIETPSSTKALKTFWSLDLDAAQPAWKVLEPWPGPARMLAVSAVLDDAFYLVSGTELSPGLDGKPVRTYLRDAFRYHPTDGWKRIADIPRPAVAVPTPAPVIGPSRFLVMGGDDGSLINLENLNEHPGFPKSILAYDVSLDTWLTVDDLPASHVTTPVVKWDESYVIPSGEVRPGVRSPRVWSFRAP